MVSSFILFNKKKLALLKKSLDLGRISIQVFIIQLMNLWALKKNVKQMEILLRHLIQGLLANLTMIKE